MARATALQTRRSRSPRCRPVTRGLVLAALAALLLQSLAPPGYMHGSADAGWPVVLCPEGLPKGFLEAVHGHHAHHHQHDAAGGQDSGLGEHCPLAGTLDQAAPWLPAGFDALANDGPLAHPSSYAAPRLRSWPRSNHTRAPPIPA